MCLLALSYIHAAELSISWANSYKASTTRFIHFLIWRMKRYTYTMLKKNFCIHVYKKNPYFTFFYIPLTIPLSYYLSNICYFSFVFELINFLGLPNSKSNLHLALDWLMVPNFCKMKVSQHFVKLGILFFFLQFVQIIFRMH